MKLLLGCTTRPYNQLSFSEACARIADAGYSDVAVFAGKTPPSEADGETQSKIPVRSDSTETEIVRARQAALASGLRPSLLLSSTSLDLGLEGALAEYKKLIDNAVTLGAHWLLECGTANQEHYDDYCTLMKEAAKHAESKGITIVLKPHGGISYSIGDLKSVYERVSQPAFRLCYDPGNIVYYSSGALVPHEDLESIAGLVDVCIIKDCVVENGKPDVMVTPGQGVVDFPAVLSGLVDGGFTGPVYVECVGGATMDEIHNNVTRTHSYISEMVGRLD